MYFLLVLFVSVILLPLTYWYYIVYIKYGSFRQLPGPKPIPIIGNKIASDSVGILTDMQQLYDKYKPRFVLYTGLQVRVIHSKSEHLQYILNSTAHTTKSENFDVLKGWIGEGLATSNGDKWRERRRMLNQSFNMNLFERFLKVFNTSSDALIQSLEKETDKKSVDLIELTNFTALDIACENLMGVKLNLKEKETKDYIYKTKVMLRIVGVRFFSFWLRYERIFLIFSKHKQIYLDFVKTLKQFTIKVIEQRSKLFKEEKQKAILKDDMGIKKKAALMDILLEEHEKGTLSYEDIREEIDTFMVAGHETSAGILSFALFELARNPDVQKQLYEEVMQVAPEGEISIDQLNDLVYTEMVVKEALRKYPQVPFMERQIEEEFELDGITYPKDCVFGIPIINMHYDPDYFPEPHKFDPTRYLPENFEKIPRYIYLPFSAGPRICIGYKYAIWSAKCSVAKVIRSFEILPVPGFDIQLEFQITLKSTTGVCVRLKKRHLSNVIA